VDSEKLQEIIAKFFVKYKNPTDTQVHKLAEKLNIDKHALEGTIYGLLSSFLYNGRYNESIRDGKNVEVIGTELQAGIGIEMEHTNDKKIAKRITLDHLAEFPDYYTRLIKMETEAEQQHEQLKQESSMKQIVRDVFEGE